MYYIAGETKLQTTVNAVRNDQICAIVITSKGHNRFTNQVIVKNDNSLGIRLVEPTPEADMNPVAPVTVYTPTGFFTLRDAIAAHAGSTAPDVVEPVLRTLGLLPAEL
jgi:hypothetical protein